MYKLKDILNFLGFDGLHSHSLNLEVVYLSNKMWQFVLVLVLQQL